MKVSEKIESALLKMLQGNTFNYKELGITPKEYVAATKAIERLIKKKVIERASTGLFYKPKKTVFGNLKPTEEELLKPYLFEGNKRIAYITGTALFNRMGITTQVPRNIKIASREKRIITKIGNIQVRPVKSYTDVTDKNYYLLELLDVIKDFKTIPDTDKTQTTRFLLNKINQLSDKEKITLIKIALKYPPRVRALTGALLDKIKQNNQLQELKNSINPLTMYKFGITTKELSTIIDWNIC